MQRPQDRAALGIRVSDSELGPVLAHFRALGSTRSSDRHEARTVVSSLILDDEVPPHTWDWLRARALGQSPTCPPDQQDLAGLALDALALSWCELHGRIVHRQGGPDGYTRWTVPGEVIQ